MRMHSTRCTCHWLRTKNEDGGWFGWRAEHERGEKEFDQLDSVRDPRADKLPIQQAIFVFLLQGGRQNSFSFAGTRYNAYYMYLSPNLRR